MQKAKLSVLPKKPAIETVEVPSRKLAVRIASAKATTTKERAEFARALVEDARLRAQTSLRRTLVAG